VYSWGEPKFGKLGHGNDSLTVAEPQRIENLHGVQAVLIAASECNSACVTADGGVYVWGLGLGGREQSSLPIQIEGLSGENIVKISLGEEHAIALSCKYFFAKLTAATITDVHKIFSPFFMEYFSSPRNLSNFNFSRTLYFYCKSYPNISVTLIIKLL